MGDAKKTKKKDYFPIRLAARILAKKLLEGEGWKEGDRLKEVQEKVGRII